MTVTGTLRGRGPAFLRRPISGVRASAGCRGNPQWRAQPAGARKKRRVHSIAHLAGLARLGEDQSPGRGQISFFLFLGPKRNNFSNLSTPFSQKKVCKVCKVCSTFFTTPLHPAIYTPPLPAPFTSSLRRPSSCCFRPDARGSGQARVLATDSGPRRDACPRLLAQPPSARAQSAGSTPARKLAV